MSKTKGLLKNYSRLLLLVIVAAGLVRLVSGNPGMWWHIFLAVMGFSAVVFIHECGHFVLAKVSDIKVETFSIFLPPVLLGVRRTENGLRFRMLPKFFPKENDPEGDGLLSFTVGRKGRAGETEYRIGLVPLAGYVKMLGQEDTGAEQIDDPRAYPNKPIGVRMAVVSAGVICNVIAAIVILMGVYLVGINRMPAVVGGVRAGSAAALAGLKGGDEIIEIAGKSDNLDFGNIVMAAALSGKDEKVALKVRHADGSVEDFAIAAEQMYGAKLKLFGVVSPQTLEIAEVPKADANELYAKTGLKPGDVIKSVNGVDVEEYWEFQEIISESAVPEAMVAAERIEPISGEIKLVESRVRFEMTAVKGEGRSETDLGHIYSLVPRLRIAYVTPPSLMEKLSASFGKTEAGDAASAGGLQEGDIILAAGGIENPTYKELRDITEAHEGRELGIEVLRKGVNGIENSIVVTVVPKRKDDRVVIGIVPLLDTERAVVAKTIGANGSAGPAIPRGAVVTAVSGVEVFNFYDIAREMARNAGRGVSIDYRVDEGKVDSVAWDVPAGEDGIAAECVLTDYIPFEPMERLYKADGVIDAFEMGCNRSVWFIAKTYVTLKGLFTRSISPKALSGPVGIATISYKLVERSFLDFLYLLAFISSNLAVINFLPIPITDGGVFVLLIVEKIKGGPVSVRVQEVISYAGLVLIATAFLYLTYNDIVNFILYK